MQADYNLFSPDLRTGSYWHGIFPHAVYKAALETCIVRANPNWRESTQKRAESRTNKSQGVLTIMSASLFGEEGNGTKDGLKVWNTWFGVKTTINVNHTFTLMFEPNH